MTTLSLPTALPALSPSLARCLLLALLLHVWLVLLLGTAPGGTARQGEGVWGAVNITLRGPEAPGTPAVRPPTVPDPTSGPPGAAALPRWGGAVREAAPARQADPGAAQVGDWARRRAIEAPVPGSLAPPPAVAAPVQVAPAPPGRVVQEQAVPMPALPPLPPSPPAPVQPAPVPAAVPTPIAAAEAPPVPAAAPERSLSSTLARDAPRPVDVPPLESVLPAAPPLRPLAMPAMPARLPELAAPPVAATGAPPAPPAQPAPEPPLRQLTAPAPQTTVPAAPLTSVTPLAPATPLDKLPGMPALGAAPVAPALGAAATPGAPDAGARVGHDLATPPSAAASTPPRLNLQLARPRGGELSRGSGGGVLQMLPRPPDVADKLAREIEKSGKADCRTAHAGAGLLAVVPLTVDALRKDGCKW